MAVNPVNLCADLQAWHSAGLSFLFFPEDEVRGFLTARPAPGSARPPVSSAGGENRAATSPATKRVAPQRPAAGSGPSYEQPASNATARSTQAQGAGAADKAASTATVPPKAAEAGRKAASAVLPEAWESLGARLKPAPVVWTYLELGEDLLVQGNPERSGALKELIASLGLKRGTSTFLPVTLPGRDCDGGEAWCFQAMLNRLGGRILVVMGEDALQRSPYAELGLACFQEKIVQGRMLLRLPSFSELLADPARFEATRVFLRSAFGKINIL